jgi:hypothetical protein
MEREGSVVREDSVEGEEGMEREGTSDRKASFILLYWFFGLDMRERKEERDRVGVDRDKSRNIGELGLIL